MTDNKKQEKIIQSIRQEIRAMGLDGFVIPHADEYQNEEQPDAAKRFEYATAFTGSAGLAIFLQKSAAIFVDGRYTLQVKDEIPRDLIDDLPLDYSEIEKWLKDTVKKNQIIGYDPRLHTVQDFEKIKKSVEAIPAQLKAVDLNPVEKAWAADRPSYPATPVQIHPLEFAGEESAEKKRRILQDMTANDVDAVIISDLASIAWLLNIRGNDLSHSPLTLSRLILHKDGRIDFFIDTRKVGADVKAHLGHDTHLHEEANFTEALKNFGNKTVQIDFAQASASVYQILQAHHADVVNRPDPCALPKAIKNPTEQNGMIQAHIRDGVAVTKFLYRMAHEGQSGAIDELTAQQWLEDYRKAAPEYLSPSFDTISGAGSNGAIVHYRASEKTNRKLEQNSLYLVDSGGQYRDGTTDITRTIAIGTPDAEMVENFTRVLKGHIAVAKAKLDTDSTTGADLDPLARAALQEVGRDFAHGTGHGVGSYLCVHEGPIGISRHYNKIPFETGMVVSNEPGYYKTGAYGIRIESLVMVQPTKNQQKLEFLTLTLAPIDRKLIDPNLLTKQETRWLDHYHKRVYKTLSPFLTRSEKAWLKQATAPFEKKIFGLIPRF